MPVRGVRKASRYYDSVALMNVARQIRSYPGVEDAAVVMGTGANRSLLAQAGLTVPEIEGATPNDLVIVIKGEAESIDQALQRAEELLAVHQESGWGSGERGPRTLRGALRHAPEANLAAISVAGAYAAGEAWDALRQGLHVLVFSDNVSLEDEIALKRYAVERGLLMMGPGAGTAIINGVALGFANAIPRGSVGIVSAAGTGLQEVSCILARQGVGVSQGIGLGGRDLSDEVGGLMMLHSVEALQGDPETRVIVAISKVPSPRIVERVISRLDEAKKPAVVVFLGEGLELPAGTSGSSLHWAATLEEAALMAASMVRGEDLAGVNRELEEQALDLGMKAKQLRSRLQRQQRFLRGLFSGGTLCEEAIRIWGSYGISVWSNSPLKPELRLADSSNSREDTALDLGAEEFTVGRPHPMIDNDLRLRRLLQEASDPSVAAIQLDLVLGYGAHPDPASELAPGIERARQAAKGNGSDLSIIASITGTDADPQNLSRQRSVLENSGAIVLESNAAASRLAALMVAD